MKSNEEYRRELLVDFDKRLSDEIARGSIINAVNPYNGTKYKGVVLNVYESRSTGAMQCVIRITEIELGKGVIGAEDCKRIPFSWIVS